VWRRSGRHRGIDATGECRGRKRAALSLHIDRLASRGPTAKGKVHPGRHLRGDKWSASTTARPIQRAKLLLRRATGAERAVHADRHAGTGQRAAAIGVDLIEYCSRTTHVKSAAFLCGGGPYRHGGERGKCETLCAKHDALPLLKDQTGPAPAGPGMAGFLLSCGDDLLGG